MSQWTQLWIRSDRIPTLKLLNKCKNCGNVVNTIINYSFGNSLYHLKEWWFGGWFMKLFYVLTTLHDNPTLKHGSSHSTCSEPNQALVLASPVWNLCGLPIPPPKRMVTDHRTIVAWVYHLVCPSGLSTLVPMTSGIWLGSNIAPVKGVEQFEVTTWLKKYGHVVKLNN